MAKNNTTTTEQDKELYLLKTGIILSISNGVIYGEYNDGHEWQFKYPPGLEIYPNSKVKLYRYHVETEPEIQNMVVIKDIRYTHFFILGKGENLIRWGITQTDEESYLDTTR